MVNKISEKYECPLDIYLFKFIDRHLHNYYEAGLTPNMVTTLGLLFGLMAAYQIIQGRFILAAAFWFFSYYFDCVDGKLARKYKMVTKFGDLYDHICDTVRYCVVFVALFLSNTQKTTIKQIIFLNSALLVLFISFIHLGYQEILYGKHEESGWLNVLATIVRNDPNPKRTIQFTKHFGCGSAALSIGLLIILWRI